MEMSAFFWKVEEVGIYWGWGEEGHLRWYSHVQHRPMDALLATGENCLDLSWADEGES